MGEDAEKKYLAELDFKTKDGKNKLDELFDTLDELAKKSEKTFETMKKNAENSLSGNINKKQSSNAINTMSELTKTQKTQLAIQETNAQRHAQKMQEIEARNQKQLTNFVKEGQSSRIAQYAKTFVIYQGFNQLKQVAFDTVDAMKSVEYRMMEISRIMEDGTIDVKQYRDELTQLAYDYGRSFDEVSTVTLNFARAGYNANDALALTEKSLLALNTAELDAAQATDGLISVMAQWGMDSGTTAEKSEKLASIIDKINKTADKFPITSEGLLEALKRTSQGFNLAGASIDETIAMIVAAERASQRGGKVIGTAMANITQQLKAEGKETLAESLGLSLFEDETKSTYKSITEIFAQMSERMQELKKDGKESSTEMQNLLELFTVFRRNIGAGLLSEMGGKDSTYAKALENSINAIGYSAQENSKYMNTMEAASKQLDATILELQNTLADEGGRGIFTAFILGAESGINVINTLIKTFGILPTTIATATLTLSLFNKNMNVDGIKKAISTFKNYSAAIKMFNDDSKKGLITAEKFNDTLKNDMPKSLQKYITNLDGATGSMAGYITKTALAKIGTLALKVTIAALEASMSFGLTLALQAAIEGLMNWINATEKAGETVSEMNNKISESKSSLSDYVKNFESLRKELDSGKLTQEEYNKYKKELIKIQDELVDKYGDEAKGIDLVTGSIEEQEKAINSLAKANYKKYIQENEKEIQKLSKTFDKEIKSGFYIKTGTNEDFTKEFKQNMKEIEKEISNYKFEDFDNILPHIEIKGTVKEVLEGYRELYDKLDEYRQNASGKELEQTNIVIREVSNRIQELEKKYGEEYETYQEYLENKLSLDKFYEENYAKILEARAELEKARLSEDPKEIEKAMQKVTDAYTDAISKAFDDPTSKKGMQDKFENDLFELQEIADKDIIKYKLEADNEKLKDDIQDILDKMGDISREDLKEAFETGEITENMQALKTVLNENNISIEDLTENFDYFGLSLGTVSEKTSETKDNMEAIDKAVESSIDKLVNLESGFTSVYNAMNEFNENGYISASTLQNLINNDLLQYFDVVNGKLAVNEAAITNDATSAKNLAFQQLAVQAAADIMAIAVGNTTNATEGAKNAADAASARSKILGNAFIALGQNAIIGADGVKKLWAAVENTTDTKGFSDEMKTGINNIISNFQKSVTALNAISVSPVTYNRVSARGSGTSTANRAVQEAEKAAKEAEKAAEEARKKAISLFEEIIDERERLEDRWVKNKKKLGLISDEDEKYILQQSIKRYKTYVDEVNQLTMASEEEKTRLRKKYGEIAEDLEVEYFELLKDILEDQIDAIEDKYKEDVDVYKDAIDEKIDKIKEQADAEIEALEKVEDVNDRIRQKEEYEANRRELMHGYQGVEYWQQRTGREAQLALAEAKKKVEDLDKNWKETVNKWNVEDQIKLIEERRDADIEATEAERDAYLKALEDTKNAEIQALRDKYQYQLDYFNQTGQIIQDNATIQAQDLFNTYKRNFIDPVGEELRKALDTQAQAPTAQAQASTVTYTIQYGDTLSGIAARYGTTIDKIMAANPYVTNRNLIYAGRQLKIPTSHTGSKILKDGIVELQAGETVLNMDWARGLDKMLGQFNAQGSNTNNITNGSTINVDGDLIKVEATIEDKADTTFLTKKLTRELENKFNIKK